MRYCFRQGRMRARGSHASAASMLEGIVVTARRREESLTDLPLSVAAITADAMQAQGVYDIMDITDLVPNVNFTHTNRRAVTSLYLRGIGNNSPVPLRSTVSQRLYRRPLPAQHGRADAEYRRR